jgi:hypothetical protein
MACPKCDTTECPGLAWRRAVGADGVGKGVRPIGIG